MKLTTKDITFTALFAALIVVGAFIKIDIPLPLYTMHFTLQWLFVLMAGFLLGAKIGALSVITYILIGLAGVPIFAAGGGNRICFTSWLWISSWIYPCSLFLHSKGLQNIKQYNY